ncbi:MAG: hypothetical protein KatS3mg113_0280 [Planctomycetaceae bacterium]|nr:MAG: hypothetical protein KatS3mg113_0280 [Planctomycetaceae bacterium]
MGVVGLGAPWERCYRSACERLRERLTIVAIWDAVPAQAHLAAVGWQARVADGLTQLFEIEPLDGVLILNPLWTGCQPLKLACNHATPAFVATVPASDLTTLRDLHVQAHQRGVLLMTDYSSRYVPASVRLRELTATCLGAVREVRTVVNWFPRSVGVPGKAMTTVQSEIMLQVLDWCGYIVGSAPQHVSVEPLPSHVVHPCCPWKVVLEYPAEGCCRPPAIAELFLHETSLTPCTGDDSTGYNPPTAGLRQQPLTFSIRCEHGRAELQMPYAIRWSNGVQQCEEVLRTDRAGTDVILDHFCRRLRGGLIPTTDLRDVCQGLELLDKIERIICRG